MADLLPLRCALYLRADGLGCGTGTELGAQRQACEAFLREHAPMGWALVAAFEDAGYGGDTPFRPGFMDLLGALRAGSLDVLVVHRPDRLWEPYLGFLDLQAAFARGGAQLVSALPRPLSPVASLSVSKVSS